ncbi:MAG: hydrogenase [Candidatus Scalindua sp.]|nr:MAG: hydrogenase [Candidatus Scalindua sp.]
MKVGKLPSALLGDLIQSITCNDKRVIIGPKIGEDATVIDFGDKYLIVKTDPVTFATQEIGWHTVQVNANDIATMGGVPKWFLVSILLPEGKTDEGMVRKIFSDINRAAEELSITLCGGHTEITYGLSRPIVTGQMLGEVDKNKLVNNANAKLGDEILLTKSIALEGMAVLAREKESELLRRYDSAFIKKVQNFLYDPGISIVKEALIANQTARVSAMHDPTEGGLSTGLWELAKVANTGVTVYAERIPCLWEARTLCADFKLDPMGVVASGALLIVVDPSMSESVKRDIENGGIDCSVIGKLTKIDEGLKIVKNGKKQDLPLFEVDEIASIFCL